MKSIHRFFGTNIFGATGTKVTEPKKNNDCPSFPQSKQAASISLPLSPRDIRSDTKPMQDNSRHRYVLTSLRQRFAARSPATAQAGEKASPSASISSPGPDTSEALRLPEIQLSATQTDWDEWAKSLLTTDVAKEQRVEVATIEPAASPVPMPSRSKEGSQQGMEGTLHGITLERRSTVGSSQREAFVKKSSSAENIVFSPLPPDSGTPSTRQGAVITADGMYDRTQLNGFIDRFITECNTVLDSIGGDDRLMAKQRQDLFSQLRKIKEFLPDEADGNVITPNLKIRDHLAAAADMASKLAGKNMLKTGRHPNADARRFYAGMAAILMQLKRTALSAAAPPLAKSWAARELAGMEKDVPNINRMSRSMLAKDTSLGISHDFGPAGLGAGANMSETFWLDDDLNANYWNTYGASISVAGPGSWPMGLQASLSAEAGSVYFEIDSMEEILRLRLNHNANHPSNRLLMQSAAPRVRKAMARFRSSRQYIEGALLGRTRFEDSDKPHYLSDNKIRKGDNQTLLHLLAEALDGLAPPQPTSNEGEVSSTRQPGAFSELVGQAFPSPFERITRGQGFPDFLGAAIPDSDPLGYGIAPFRNGRTALSMGISEFLGIESGVSTGARGAATLSVNTAQFHLQNVEPSNRLLDPDYHADMALTFKLVNQIDAKRGHSPRMHLYRKVNEQFGMQSGADLNLSDIDQRYYGPVDAIPACFRTAIAAPQSLEEVKQRIDELEQYCGQLHRTYIEFMNYAAHIMAKPDRFTREAVLPKLRTLREDAFKFINKAVWGADGEDGETPGYPPGMQAALKDPDAFIAASHDAIGLALGLAGIYLAIAKRKMTPLASGLDSSERITCVQAIRTADEAYMTAKTALNRPGVPIKKERLFLLDSTFEDRGTSQRHNVVAQISGSGGMQLNMFDAIAEQAGGSMEGYSISNAAGTVTGALRLRLQHADLQINPSRQGQFIEIKITLTAGAPVIGQALVETLMHGLKKLYSSSSNADEWKRQRTSLTEQLQGSVWNISTGAGVTVRLRRFPNAEPLGFRLQFVQVHDQKTDGASIGIPLPHPGGITALGLSRQHTLQNVVTEYMGPDIGYLMLQHKKLERVMKCTASIAEEYGAAENEVLACIFSGNADSGAPWHEAISDDLRGTLVAENYFGIGSMIPKLIDDYLAYLRSARTAEQTAQAEQSGDIPHNAHFENEFHRYYDSTSQEEPFRRVAEIAREAKHYAPGSTFHARSGAGEPADPFEVPPSLRTPVAPPDSSSGWNWDQAKETIKGLDTLQKRIEYYCNEQGRPVLDWFVRIIENTRTIHNLSRHRARATDYGFETRLRNPGNSSGVLMKSKRSDALAEVGDPGGSQTA